MTHIENYNGTIYHCDDTYSDKDHTGHDLSDRTDMSGIVIHGLCLSHETPNAQVLPSNLTGTTFLSCNLDNVHIPPGNTLINCSHRQFKVQNDGQDWIVAGAAVLSPTLPLNLAYAVANGLNTNPALIPATPILLG